MDKYRQIKDKYEGNVDDGVFTYLRRNYPVSVIDLKGWQGKPFKVIYIDDRQRPLMSKKEITQRIYNDLEYSEKFSNMDQSIVRRTIKMYLDYQMVD